MAHDDEFADFFRRGERLSDISELMAFAMAEEERGDHGEAAQLYRWTLELIHELGALSAETSDLHFFADEALLRLASRQAAA
jgi:hypothetical protein